jgi:hypothetical protein
MKKTEQSPEKSLVDRRKFLKGAAAGGMATLAASAGAIAAQPFAAASSIPAAAVPAPAEGDAALADVLTTDRPGSDFRSMSSSRWASSTWPRIPDRVSAVCTNRLSTTAEIVGLSAATVVVKKLSS